MKEGSVGIYVMHKKVCIPKTTHEFFQKRKQNEQIKYWSCPMSLLFFLYCSDEAKIVPPKLLIPYLSLNPGLRAICFIVY